MNSHGLEVKSVAFYIEYVNRCCQRIFNMDYTDLKVEIFLVAYK